jgi:DNA-binding CsgD family transcriptional regulator
MDGFVSASVATTTEVPKSAGPPWRTLSSPVSHPLRGTGRRTDSRSSVFAGRGEQIPSRRGSLKGAGDQEKSGHLAAALIELGYSVEYAPDEGSKLASMLANRLNVVLCICSTTRMSDLELLEQFSEANSHRRAMPTVLLMGKHNSARAEDGTRADKCSSVRMRLTVREKDVLTWVARGKTSAEIAIILGLSERTINFHCDKAMKRLDVINRTQAVAKAIAEGLIGI